MKRRTRERLIKARKVSLLSIFILGIGLVLWKYQLSRYTDVKIADKSLDCEGQICILSVTLRNQTSSVQSGYVAINYLKMKSSTSNMGSNDGHIYKIFAKERIEYKLSPKEEKVLREPYLHPTIAPMVTANLVPNKGI